MNEPELFLVTLELADGSHEVDMELPSEMPIGELAPRVLEVLKGRYEGELDGWEKCCFEHNSKVFAESDTLLSRGAFDGSRLLVYEDYDEQ
ncbi:MAG: EsaB/YukD family protein [Synergistaceae bacterium]|nr:EsaB/YukD family protein [Synergistaceae bacterium]